MIKKVPSLSVEPAGQIGHHLILENVCLSLRGTRLIGPINLTVSPGSIATVMGPSGCGKSSLLAYLCGTLTPDFVASGRVLLRHSSEQEIVVTDLAPERRRLGILFQDDLLFPHLSVSENLMFGLDPSIKGRRDRHRIVAQALVDLEMADYGDMDPATLSGGQRARIALMRTLLAAPMALLLDEPFSRLDGELRTRFRQFVFDHARRRGLPTLLVTHDSEDGIAAGGPRLDVCASDIERNQMS